MPRRLSILAQALTSPNRACRGVLLGSILKPSIDEALNLLVTSTFPKLYTQNWLKDLSPLTISQVKQIIKGAIYYYKLGYDTKDYKSFFRNLQKSFPNIQPLLVTKVLGFLSGIDKNRFPYDYKVLTTGKIDSKAIDDQFSIAQAEHLESISEEIKDKAKRGVKAVTSSAIGLAKETSAEMEKSLPWYMRPSFIVPLGLVVGALVFSQSKTGQALIRPFYKKNPISKRDLAKKSYEIFHDRKPKKTIAIPEIDCKELVQLGTVLELGYRSNKWTGKQQNYLHSFDKGVRLMCTPDRKTLVLSGGKMEVQDVGIVH